MSKGTLERKREMPWWRQVRAVSWDLERVLRRLGRGEGAVEGREYLGKEAGVSLVDLWRLLRRVLVSCSRWEVV